MWANAHVISSLYTHKPFNSRYLEICVVHMFEDQSRSSRLNEQKKRAKKTIKYRILIKFNVIKCHN